MATPARVVAEEVTTLPHSLWRHRYDLVTRAVHGRIPLVRLPEADEVHGERVEGCDDRVHLLLRRPLGRVIPQRELVPPALLHL